MDKKYFTPGSMLRTARSALNLKQADIQRSLSNKISQQRLSEIERGCKPTKEEARLLSDVLGLPIGDLFPDLAQGSGEKAA